MEETVYLFNFIANVGTLNNGDYIIMDSIEKTLGRLFTGGNVFLINLSSHQPLTYHHRKLIRKLVKEGKQIKFILSGANPFHLYYSPFSTFNQWAVGVLDTSVVRDIVLFGTGTIIARRNPKHLLTVPYSKWFWSRVLNREFPHAVRDRESLILLRELGFNNAVNLGCPTLWMLTKNHCRRIPRKKAEEVVTTVNYMKKSPADLKVLKLLFDLYENVYIWPQEPLDVNYALDLSKRLGKPIEVIPPTLSAYDKFLSQHDVDYVGVRVHGGIRALQREKRAIIVSIDHRAISFSRSFNLPEVPRNEPEKLGEKITSEFRTKILIPEELIGDYLNALREYIGGL